MSDLLEYKGFKGTVEFSSEDSCLFGKVLFIQDSIMYDGESIDEVTISFKQAVDDYLELCAEVGKTPNKPFSGNLQVRIGEELHEKCAIEAASKGMKLNPLLKMILTSHFEERATEVIHKHNHQHVFKSEESSITHDYSKHIDEFRKTDRLHLATSFGKVQ